MTNDYADEWDLGSGLSLDGATATVTDMEFGYNNNIGAGITCANFTLETDDGEIIEQSFSVGGKNEANADGTILEGSGKINKRSNYGLLLQSVMDVIDNPGEVIGRVRATEGWIGTTWVWGTVDMETRNPATGETKKSSKFIVTEYLGREADGGKGDGKSKGKSKPKSKSDVTDDPMWDELVQMATDADDHDTFVDAALELDGVEGNSALQRAIMKTGDGSVWAAAHES